MAKRIAHAAMTEVAVGYNQFYDKHESVQGGRDRVRDIWEGVVNTLNNNINKRYRFIEEKFSPKLWDIPRTTRNHTFQVTSLHITYLGQGYKKAPQIGHNSRVQAILVPILVYGGFAETFGENQWAYYRDHTPIDAVGGKVNGMPHVPSMWNSIHYAEAISFPYNDTKVQAPEE
jgi:hypothetical protein